MYMQKLFGILAIIGICSAWACNKCCDHHGSAIAKARVVEPPRHVVIQKSNLTKAMEKWMHSPTVVEQMTKNDGWGYEKRHREREAAKKICPPAWMGGNKNSSSNNETFTRREEYRSGDGQVRVTNIGTSSAAGNGKATVTFNTNIR